MMHKVVISVNGSDPLTFKFSEEAVDKMHVYMRTGQHKAIAKEMQHYPAAQAALVLLARWTLTT